MNKTNFDFIHIENRCLAMKGIVELLCMIKTARGLIINSNALKPIKEVIHKFLTIRSQRDIVIGDRMK